MQKNKKNALIISLSAFLIIGLLTLSCIFVDPKVAIVLSCLIIILAMFPFIFIFEQKKPSARIISILAVFCALTVVFNLASISVLPFQAGTAMVILCGVIFGPNSGFLVGVVARFIINFFYGHGPWTCWQMIAWGILGFLAGILFFFNNKEKENPKKNWWIIPLSIIILTSLAIVLTSIFSISENVYIFIYLFGIFGFIIAITFSKKYLKPSFLHLSIFGFFSTFFIYGCLMNLSTAVFSGAISPFNISSIITIFLVGLPFDLAHAIGCALFLALFSPLIIKVMDRLKIKYDLKI